MNVDELLGAVKRERFVVIDGDCLRALFARSEILREETPAGVEPIRVLRCGDDILVQETSDKSEILVRRFESRDDAYRFVRARQDAYDRIWDGCGCRVEYYE